MIRLIPMSDLQYDDFWARCLLNYAQDLARAGNVEPDQAMKKAESQVDQLLPEGRDTPGHYFVSIHDEERDVDVGFLWYGVREGDPGRPVFIYDFFVFEKYRRQGYGTQALQALEEAVLALGLDRIVLHVFGHNHPAQALYRKLGYVPTNITMVKEL
jgi:GNAT superfamily N-acetyltransferase